MMKPNKIGSKIIVSYFIILLIGFVVTIMCHNLLAQRYLEKEARAELRKEVRYIANILNKIPLADKDVKEKLLTRRELKIAGRLIDSKMIVFNKNRRVIYSNLNLKNIDRKKILRLIKSQNGKLEGYISEKLPILTQKGDIKGHIFLMMELKELKAVDELMKRTRIISFTVAGIVAIIIGIFLQMSMTKPIKQLMNHMTNFSLKEHKEDFYIKTGDEIEELSLCFSSLTNRLKRYDLQQKMFLQNTSHELKTPLMSIQGYAEAIKDGVVEGQEMEESLEIIMGECQRLKKTVEEITYLTKLENVEETFQLKDRCMEEILNAALKSIKPLADEKNIKIHVEGDFGFKGFYDEDKIKRVWINLLGNGIRYAKENIVVKSLSHSKYVEIMVSDDGEGFKSGEEQKVFDRFYKGQNGNTGLGLAITKAIVEGHKGEITAYNHKSGGAVFAMKLPKS